MKPIGKIGQIGKINIKFIFFPYKYNYNNEIPYL